MEYDLELNAEGLFCPEPVMMLHARVNELDAGQTLKVSATDPSTQRDIPKFCQFLGHTLIGEEERDGVFYYWIKIA